jgi:hypothetical protein
MNSRFSEEKRQPPYYLITGFLLGIIIGFIVTMVVFPVQYTNAPPETLNQADKDRYRVMIALAYQANQDIGRATARLGLLRDDDIAGQLIQQSRRSQTRSDAQILLNLAQAIQNPNSQPVVEIEFPTATIAPTETPEFSPTLTNTPTISPTVEITETLSSVEASQPSVTRSLPVPTSTATVIQNTNLAFRLSENQLICNTSYQDSLIQIEVFDGDGKPIPNSKIIVAWATGQNTFYTGYFPDVSLGYADFSMEPETVYSVKVGDIGELVSNLKALECQSDTGNSYWGSIYLRFDAP